MGPFYLRRLRRRPWRPLCVLLLCAAFAALLCRLSEQAAGQERELERVHSSMDVRCTVSDVRGTSTTSLRMSEGIIWRVTDPEGPLTPHVRDLRMTKEFYYDCAELGVSSGALTGVTDESCAEALDPAFGAEGEYFSEGFYGSSDLLCLVSEGLYSQLGGSGSVALALRDPYGELWGDASGEYEFTVAGRYPGGGTEIYIPWPCAAGLMEELSGTLSCDSMTFYARDNRRLGALAEAAASTFCPVDPAGSSTIYSYALTVHDSQYLETVETLEASIRRTQLTIPALLLGALAAGLLSSYLYMRGERRSFALMRTIGMPRARLALAMLSEQLVPQAAGCALAAAVFGRALPAAALFACTLLGVCAGAAPVIRQRPAALLSKKE